MNNVNRGVIRGVAYSLENAIRILSAIADREADKEMGLDGGAPTNSKFGEYSDNITYAVDSIEDALGYLASVIPEVDFDQYLK